MRVTAEAVNIKPCEALSDNEASAKEKIMSNKNNQMAAEAAAKPAKKFDTKRLAVLGLLTAVIIVLQVLNLAIRPTGIFNITLCLVPIIVGAALYGAKAGAWLGFVFGAIALTDAALFLAVNIPATILVCLLKGTLAGLAAGLVFKLLEKKNVYVATFTAGIVCPIVNTGVFTLGCFAFFMPTLEELGVSLGYEDTVTFLFVGVITVNFFVELAVNLVLGSVIALIIKQGRKELGGKASH